MSQWGATRRPWLEEYFEEKGWVAARTPPKHPEFQPIELFWAAVKGNIGRAYDTNTTFDIVGRRLRREFDANHDGLIRKLIQSARSAEDAQRTSDIALYDQEQVQLALEPAADYEEEEGDDD